MKFINQVTLLLFASLLLLVTSCKKLLESEPTGSLSPDQYFEKEEHLTHALTSVYSTLMADAVYGGELWGAFDIADEMFYSGTSNYPAFSYQFNASEFKVSALWETLYRGIADANLLLEHIDKPQMDETRRLQLKGQTLFLRAYFYFLLVSNWGDVPLILQSVASPTGNDIARTPASEVYGQILEDMEAAEQMVGDISELQQGGTISRSTVRGILARVNLYMAGFPLNRVDRYQHAKDWAYKVISDETSDHRLNPSYEQVFINYIQDKYDFSESIWEVEFWGNRQDAFQTSGRLGSRNGIYMIQPASSGIGFSLGQINCLARLYRRYGTGDLRKDWNIAPFRYNNNGAKVLWQENQLYQRNCGKFRREYELLKPQNQSYTPINFPLLRFSDVLLMYAEAGNEVNGPSAEIVEMINMVRRRGYGKDIYAVSDIDLRNEDVSDKDGFRHIIQEERSRELCFEGLRRMDLIRWGIFVPRMKSLIGEIDQEAPSDLKKAADAARYIEERNLYLPIPVSELSLNRELSQNNGW